MVDSLINCKNLEEFISNHHQKCRTHKKQLKRKIFKNLEYKKDLHKMFEESEYSFTLIKKELSSRWKELWMNIEEMRFRSSKPNYKFCKRLIGYLNTI